MPTNAEVIAATLAGAGVEFAFGLPGGEIGALIHACREAGIRFFLTGHEASAAFMADVTGQISGRAGVCMATLGPGAMNLCLGVANALLDRSPVLAITAQIPAAMQPHFPHQRLALTSVFGAICKHSEALAGNETAAVIERCLCVAATPPWGPVYLALPSDVAAREATPSRAAVLSQAHPSAGRAGASPDDILGLWQDAQRPLMVAGVGCLPKDVPALRRFVERTGVPFVVTPKAKGTLPEDAPGFLGVVGGMALDRTVLEIVEQADLLLGAGFDPVECDKDWYVSRRIANLSRAATAEGAYHPVEVIGDIGGNLDLLASQAAAKPWPPSLLAESRARLRPAPIRSGDGLSPLEAVRTLRAVLPPETILTCDVGSHKFYAGQFWECHQPHTFFMSNGLSAMGYGIPAAIAARLHFPDRPVVALVGDGGLLMMLHNLVFLRHYEIPVIIVCFVDESLSLIRIGQQRRGLDPYGVDFPAPDFAGIAEAFGITGIRVRSLEDLKQAVDRAARTRRATLVHVPVNKREYEAYV
jgi:acetolactate synthase-1/2/3 large subunit